MAVDLSDYNESLLRAIQPPGATTFSSVPATDLTGYLSDAFWEARLDGFFEGFAADDEGIVTPTVGADEFSRTDVALVILYAAITILRNRITSLGAMFRAKAGPVEFEQQNSATVLAEMLKQLRLTKEHILEDIGDEVQTTVSLIDAFSARIFYPEYYFGSPELAG